MKVLEYFQISCEPRMIQIRIISCKAIPQVSLYVLSLIYLFMSVFVQSFTEFYSDFIFVLIRDPETSGVAKKQ